MRKLLSAFSSVVLFVFYVMCSCGRSDAQGVPTPAQIITDGDWMVEKKGGAQKAGDKFVMRFDKTTKNYRRVVIEQNNIPEEVQKKRLALDLQNPIGKWSSRNGKIVTERFIDKWRSEITVDGKKSFKMINSGGDEFRGTQLGPIPPAAPPAVQPPPPPAVQPPP